MNLPPKIEPLPTYAHRPLWTVVIPVVKKRQGLFRCLMSVKDQLQDKITRKEAEIVIINFTNQKLDTGGLRDIWIRSSGSMSLDWNTCISQSYGRYIHLLHDDDWVDEGFYDIMEHLLVKAWAASTGYRNVREDGQVCFQNAPTVTRELLSQGNPLQPPAVVIRREAYELVGGYRPDLIHCPDWELYHRVASIRQDGRLGWANDYQKRILANYSIGGDSITATAKWVERLESTQLALDYIYESHKDPNLDANARGYQASQAFNTAIAIWNEGKEEEALAICKEALKIAKGTSHE